MELTHLCRMRCYSSSSSFSCPSFSSSSPLLLFFNQPNCWHEPANNQLKSPTGNMLHLDVHLLYAHPLPPSLPCQFSPFFTLLGLRFSGKISTSGKAFRSRDKCAAPLLLLLLLFSMLFRHIIWQPTSFQVSLLLHATPPPPLLPHSHDTHFRPEGKQSDWCRQEGCSAPLLHVSYTPYSWSKLCESHWHQLREKFTRPRDTLHIKKKIKLCFDYWNIKNK